MDEMICIKNTFLHAPWNLIDEKSSLVQIIALSQSGKNLSFDEQEL